MSRIRVRRAPDPGSFIMMRTVLHFESRDLKGAPRARTQTSPSDRVSCRHHRGAGYACLPVLGAVYVSLYAADARPMPRIVVTACGGVVAIGVLVSFFRLMFARREPSCVHPAGERNIEVTLAALSSCARTAAERDDRVMVEHVEARVQAPTNRASVLRSTPSRSTTGTWLPLPPRCSSVSRRPATPCSVRRARSHAFVFAVQDYRPDRGGSGE